MKFLANLDLNLNQIKNGVFDCLASAPEGKKKGQFYYNTTDNKFYIFNGTDWKADAEGTVKSVNAKTGEKVISVDNTDATAPVLEFKISATQGTGITLSQETDGLKASVQDGTTSQKGIVQLSSTPSSTEEGTAITPKGATIDLQKQETAEEGYAATYVLYQGGSALGVKINIPLDYLVKDANVKVCTEDDKPVEGLKKGDKYVDFEVNAKEGTGTAGHLYIPVKDMFTPYGYANGITIDADNNIKIDNTVTEQTTQGLYPIAISAAGLVTAYGNAQKTVKVKSATLAKDSTSATVALTDGQDYVDAYAKDSYGSKVMCDIKIETTGVIFSISEAYANDLTCVVIYRDATVE